MIVDTASYEGLVYDRILAEHAQLRATLRDRRTLAHLVRIHELCEDIVLLPLLAHSRELAHAVRRIRSTHAALDAHLDTGALLDHLAEEEELLLPGARVVLSDHHAAELLVIWDRERELLLRGVHDA